MVRTAASWEVKRCIAAVAVALVASSGCRRVEPEPAVEETRGSAAGSSVAQGKVEVLKAPPGDDAAAVIREKLEDAKSRGRDLVVYVGATWCEPCQYFHRAAEHGDLDAQFPTLTLLEFDLDVDGARLAAAGYKSELIPLFVVPENDGRASARRFEGSIKGERAVANITPRLRSLLAK